MGLRKQLRKLGIELAADPVDADSDTLTDEQCMREDRARELHDVILFDPGQCGELEAKLGHAVTDSDIWDEAWRRVDE